MIGEILGELLGAALAPGGRFGEWLAALICFAVGIFSFGFGIWFVMVGAAETTWPWKAGIMVFFALFAGVCFWLVFRFLRSAQRAL